jgi:hypothetical protein
VAPPERVRVRSANVQIAGTLTAGSLTSTDRSGGTLTAGDANIRAIEEVPRSAGTSRLTFTGTSLTFGSLSVGHATAFLTPHASTVTVTGTVDLQPHFYTQCYGQTSMVPAGNGKGQMEQPMVCASGATTPAADCVMGGTPKGPLTTDPSWLHAYSALNAWCFKDSAGAALFSSVSCPGGSESACLGYCCTNSSYVHCGGYTDTVCQGRCRALCS